MRSAFGQFAEAVGKPELVSDPQYARNIDRKLNYATLKPILVTRHDIAAIWVAFFSRWQRYLCRQDEAFLAKPRREWLDYFEEEGVPCVRSQRSVCAFCWCALGLSLVRRCCIA